MGQSQINYFFHLEINLQSGKILLTFSHNDEHSAIVNVTNNTT